MKVFVFDLLAYGKHFDQYKATKYLPYPLPGDHYDREVAARTYEEHLKCWEEMDKLGFDGVGLNEHHTTPHGMMNSPNMMAAVGAQRTKKLKFLMLGNLLPLHDPLRLAEELAMLDCLSNGRIVSGFARGIPREYNVYKVPLAESRARFEEAWEIIYRAWTEEVFSFEGRFWSYRDVAIWPRPVQQPHPPVWTTTGNKSQARLLGEKGYVMATLGSGYATRPLYDAYRAGYLAKWKKPAPADRVAYLGLVAVADNETEARRRGELVAGYLRSSAIVHVPFRNPPGFLSVDDNAKMLRGMTPPRSFTKDGRAINMHHGSVQDLIDAGILFCGTPDQVHDQIIDFTEYCGGMGNLLMMGHAGFLTHEDTMSNLEMFSKQVMPRLKAYKQPVPETVAA